MIKSAVDFKPLGEAIQEMWNTSNLEGIFHWIPVNLLRCNIPVYEVEESLRDLVPSYMSLRYDGNLELAKSEKKVWIGHTLAKTIPRVELLMTALSQGNYTDAYTEDVIFTELYKAVLKVNPQLRFSNITWPDADDELSTYQKGLVPHIRWSVKQLKYKWEEDVSTLGDVHRKFEELLYALDKCIKSKKVNK